MKEERGKMKEERGKMRAFVFNTVESHFPSIINLPATWNLQPATRNNYHLIYHNSVNPRSVQNQ
jgi:hypothetical protein